VVTVLALVGLAAQKVTSLPAWMLPVFIVALVEAAMGLTIAWIALAVVREGKGK
jgi:hypothetical protein